MGLVKETRVGFDEDSDSNDCILVAVCDPYISKVNDVLADKYIVLINKQSDRWSETLYINSSLSTL